MPRQRDVLLNMIDRPGRQVFLRIFNLLLIIALTTGKSCDPSDLVKYQCPDTQVCDDTKTCACRPGFKAQNETFCVLAKPQDSHSTTPNHSSLVSAHSSGSIVAGILIPLILILLVIYAVYLNRKYDLVSRLRRRLHQRSNNYDEFMIGQDHDPDDDPPLG